MESVDYTDFTADKHVINVWNTERSFHSHELEDVFAMIPPKENVIFFNTLNCIQLICLLSSKDKYYVRTYVETINIFPT